MSKPTHTPGEHQQLRRDAEERLKQGTTPTSRGWTVSADALALLYRLASNPAEAGEALKLLHELQTHQVELDLQHEQLVANEQEILQDRDRYKALFDFAPVGYFTLALDGRVIETNLEGSELLGVSRASLAGQPLSAALAPESESALAGLIKALRNGQARASCEVRCQDRNGGDGRRLRVMGDLCASGEAVLMIVAPINSPLEG